jgi:hypothetical protein
VPEAIMATRRRRRRRPGGKIPNAAPSPTIAVVWHPDVLSPQEYEDLILTLTEVERAHGAEGLARVRSETVDAAVPAEVLG